MKNLVHKIASSGGTVSRLNRATGLGCGRLGNFGRLAGPENRAVRHLGGCVSGVSPTRPTMLISCNNSGRFPLYGVDGNVRRMERNMNAMIRARSTMRQVTLAALGGRSLRLPGATAAGIGCQITGPGELFHHTLEFRPYSQQKAEHNHAPQPSDQSSTRNQAHRQAIMKSKTILLSTTTSTMLLFFASGCSTMKVPPLTTGSAGSYAQHEQKDGLVVGIQPMTDKREINDMFKVDLLDKGVLPVLIVAENQSASASFIMARDKISIQNEATGTASSSQRGKVTSGTGQALETTGVIMVGLGPLSLATAVVGLPLASVGMQKASSASVIEFNLADKEFYSSTLGPGAKAQGFLYYQFPKGSPPSGIFHVVAEIKNPASGETTAFDFPVNITPSH